MYIMHKIEPKFHTKCKYVRFKNADDDYVLHYDIAKIKRNIEIQSGQNTFAAHSDEGDKSLIYEYRESFHNLLIMALNRPIWLGLLLSQSSHEYLDIV